MNRPPLVSVCIPSYNYREFLPAAIESVLAQTERRFELIVVDDASTDGTPEVVRPYLSDERVELRINEQNLGLFGNFNLCLESGRGGFVKLLLADDWLHPRYLEASLEAFSRGGPGVGMVAVPAVLVDVDGRPTGLRRGPFRGDGVVARREAITAHAEWGNVAGMPTNVLLRRSILAGTGGFEPAFEPASDVHLWLKILLDHDIAWIDEPLCSVRIHEQHTHSYSSEPGEGVFLLWEDIGRRNTELVPRAVVDRALYAEARHILLYAALHLIAGRFRRARELAATAHRHVPWRRALPRLALDLPRLLRGEAARRYALRTGRFVVYEPLPRVGAARC